MKRTLLACLLLTAAWGAAADSHVAFPTTYRGDFHVKSMVIQQGHPLFEAVGGMHHLYANKKALAGYKAGGKFADGAVITFDLFEAVAQDNAIAEGAHKAVLVMARDSRKFKATDGWGYQVFDPKTRKASLDAKAAAECHACHLQQKDKGFVFSALRD
ncbi:cytochrome P460 family protein [Aromatoleum petrolei]|uniref:Cytochrome C n=1 Tax=Aromatoleum petrolei TaxID=76116 RepID=A0ABX1MUG5_9RHOO|nr:cytochrome P460 family protein [Aromatoleum petrolei]NMF91595.1 cytochrome C [Aromatoleum petrolei]QTQ37044.1 Putative cytochrome c [Aromatoleum petrolei]